MAKKTIKDLEAETGKPDSIRNVTGKNARSDKHVETLEKQLGDLVPDLTLPASMPSDIVIRYSAGTAKWLTGDELRSAAAVLNALGLL